MTDWLTGCEQQLQTSWHHPVDKNWTCSQTAHWAADGVAALINPHCQRLIQLNLHLPAESHVLIGGPLFLKSYRSHQDIIWHHKNKVSVSHAGCLKPKDQNLTEQKTHLQSPDLNPGLEICPVTRTKRGQLMFLQTTDTSDNVHFHTTAQHNVFRFVSDLMLVSVL